MGMSIDEVIKQLETYTIPCGKYKAAYDIAVDTMRKYQKIEEIYKNWCFPTYFNATDAMNKLGKVLKDGDD